jgi:hypothetical protein
MGRTSIANEIVVSPAAVNLIGGGKLGQGLLSLLGGL